MADMNVYSPGDIYAPVERAQEYQAKQNSLAAARQQEMQANMLRNVVSQNIDPRTGRTNWQGAMSAAPQQLLPQLQGMMGESEKAAAELSAKQATTRNTEMEGDAKYWQNQRNLAALPHTQTSWSAWRETLPEWSRQYVPEQFTPAAQQQVMRDSAAAIAEFNRQNLTAEQQSMAADRAAQREISRGQLGVSQGQLKVAQDRLAFDQSKQATDLSPAEAARQRALGESQAKFQVAFPQAKADAQQAIDLIDQMVGTKPYRDKKTGGRVQDKAPHPGLGEAVGVGFGTRLLPGSSASDFESLFNQVQGGAFLQAYETLRGGGAITETEGKKATAARNRMSLAQSESEFIKAAREYQDVLREGIKRAEARAGVPSETGGGGSPAVGAVEDGHRFKGGDPADPNNWVKL